MPTRHDTSRVPLQGGYVAKQCPVRAQNDALQPGRPLEPDAFLQRLFDNGNRFEAEVLAELLAAHGDAVTVTGEDSGAREDATLAAMNARAPLILGARLPADLAGRRVGKPDVLVAARGGGYWPVDIKWHQNLEADGGGKSALPGLCSTLAAPGHDAAAIDPDFAARKKEEDLLQLAHYQRMLEAIGMDAGGGRWGAIVGTERRVVWYDLDAPIWRTPSLTGTTATAMRSTIARYDFEFDFRLDVIAVAEQHAEDESVRPLVVPVKISECSTCPWWPHCAPQLERPPGDVSLLPHIGWAQWKRYRDHGVGNRAELAALDPLTASYPDVSSGSLLAHIDLARAALGPERVYRRRGLSEVRVTRADIELDVDMESTEVGCYLWGTYLSDRTGAQIEPAGYRAFATWQPLGPDSETTNGLEFWRWLLDLRRRCRDADLTFAAYCYNASAENTSLRRLALAAGVTGEIDAFIASGEWVDLLREWDSQLITGGSSGLKTVAPLTGFRWEVEDAGGGESMLKHDDAVGGDSSARQWLLAYNRGDVQATLAVREWMSAASCPEVGEIAPHAWERCIDPGAATRSAGTR